MRTFQRSLIAILVLSALLATNGCSTNQQPKSATPIQVTFQPQPASPVKAGQPVTLSVFVKQDEKAVTDASDVKFEIWKEHREESQMLDATKGSSGEYYVKHVFSDAGTYHVMYHVTARDQHSMKDMKIDVVK